MKLQRQFTDGKCTHMRVIHTGTHPEQNFSQRLIAAGLGEGWVSLDGDTLTMKTDGEPLRYTIVRKPGYYCKSTGEPMPVSSVAWGLLMGGQGQMARAETLAWLTSRGKAGDDYDLTVAFECVIDGAQHARNRAVIGPKGMVVAAHKLEA